MIDNSMATVLAGLKQPAGAVAAAAGPLGDSVGTAGLWYARDLNGEVGWAETWGKAHHAVVQARTTITQAPYHGTPNGDIRPVVMGGKPDYVCTPLGALAILLAAGRTDPVVHHSAIYFAQYTHLPTAALPYYTPEDGVWDTVGLARAGLLPYDTDTVGKHLPALCPTQTLDGWLAKHYTLSPHQMGLAAAVHAIALGVPFPGSKPPVPTAPKPLPKRHPAPGAATPVAPPAPTKARPLAGVPGGTGSKAAPPAPQRTAPAGTATGVAPQGAGDGSAGSTYEGALGLLRTARLPDGGWSARALYNGLGYSSWSNYTRILKRVVEENPTHATKVVYLGQPDYTINNAAGLIAYGKHSKKYPELRRAIAAYTDGYQ